MKEVVWSSESCTYQQNIYKSIPLLCDQRLSGALHLSDSYRTTWRRVMWRNQTKMHLHAHINQGQSLTWAQGRGALESTYKAYKIKGNPPPQQFFDGSSNIHVRVRLLSPVDHRRCFQELLIRKQLSTRSSRLWLTDYRLDYTTLKKHANQSRIKRECVGNA